MNRLLLLLLFATGHCLLWADTSAAQETRELEKRLHLETRDVPNGRIDVNDRVWRARYRIDRNIPFPEPEKFLVEEANDFGWSATLNDLTLVKDRRRSASRHQTYQQQFQGVPVEGRYIQLSFDRDDEPSMVLSGYTPLRAEPDFSPKPTVAPTVATQKARTQLADQAARFAAPSLVVLPEKKPILAWKIVAWPSTQPAEYVIFIDAQSGELLSMRDDALSFRGRAVHASERPGEPVSSRPALDPNLSTMNRVDGTGFVFDPDPLTVTGVTYGPPYVDAGDAANAQLNAARSLVTLPDISQDNQGMYVLEGPYVRIVGENQSNSTTYSPPRVASPSGFMFTRDDDEFEAVNAYYHLDQSQRYVQSLGILDRQNLPIRVNPLGFSNDDSFYFPSQNFLIFGSGGVDDAEDASVLWHEYGHALLNAATPGLLSSLEGTALHEGWADYWSASYARHLYESGAVPRSDWERIFKWDSGDGTIWNGRVLDHTGYYPQDTCSDDPSPVNCSPHNDGRLWATVLMELYSDLGRTVVDELNLRSHLYLAAPVTFRDAAEAIVQADVDYFSGAHIPEILNRFGPRGLVDAGSFAPTVFHDELPWSEDLGGTIRVIAEAVGLSAPVSEVLMRYETTAGDPMTLTLSRTVDDIYEGDLELPSVPDSVFYYLEVTDAGSRKGFVPASAPVEMFSFGIGPDVEPPSLEHAPVNDIPLVTWPPRVVVNATDNLGMDRVSVSFRIEAADTEIIENGHFILTEESNGETFSDFFPVDAGSLPQNVTVYYWIEGVDASVAGHSTRLPATGEFDFVVRSEGVLRSFDFEIPASGVLASGLWERGVPTYGLESAWTGQKVMATGLGSPYPAASQLSTLELPRVNLNDVSNGLLIFWHWFDTEHDGTADPSESGNLVWDGGNMEVSSDGGSTWSLLLPENGYNGEVAQAHGNPLASMPAFGGYSYGWRQVVAPLPEASDVRIRFNFGTDGSNSDVARFYAGWYLDDIRISTVRPDDGASPFATSLPPSSETYSLAQIQPFIQASFSDDNGVTDAFFDYSYQTDSGETLGSMRMELDPGTRSDYFAVAEFLSDPKPSDRLEYQFRISDYSDNVTVLPSPSTFFAIDYELVQKNEVTQQVSVSGIWEALDSGWTSTGAQVAHSFVSSINFFPVDLPANATTVQFSLIHRYELAPDFGGNVKISVDGGRTWEVVPPDDGYPDYLSLDYLHPMRNEPAFAEASPISGQIESIFDLESYAGKQIRLRVDLATPRAAEPGENWRIEAANLKISTDEVDFDVERMFALHPAFPNPFDHVSHIGFTIEAAGPADLTLYDMLGRRVRRIVDGDFEPGSYERSISAHDLSPGIYVLRLQSNGQSDTKTLVVTH